MSTIIIGAERLDTSHGPFLRDAMGTGLRFGNLWVDMSQTEFVGGRCLEIMLAARKTAEGAGRKLKYLAPSSTLAEHLESAGANWAVLETEEAH